LDALACSSDAPNRVDRFLLCPGLKKLYRLLHARHARIERGDAEVLQVEPLVGLGELLFGGGEFSRHLVQARLVGCLCHVDDFERLLGRNEMP
jgi:hypothetical protein